MRGLRLVKRRDSRTVLCISALLGLGVAIFGVLFFAQDLEVFPELMDHPFGVDPGPLPKQVQSLFIQTEDNQEINAWDYNVPGAHHTAIVFHGNGDLVSDAFEYQQWLAALGISSYAFDYRGYGLSSGWPSEDGLYSDAEAVWHAALDRDHRKPSDMILVGFSLGTGIAAYTASRFHPAALVMMAPYASIPDVVDSMPVFKYFTPLLRYNIPTKSYVKNSPAPCLVIAHGKQDDVIPVENTYALDAIVRGKERYTEILDDKAGHEDIFERDEDKIGQALTGCVQPM